MLGQAKCGAILLSLLQWPPMSWALRTLTFQPGGALSPWRWRSRARRQHHGVRGCEPGEPGQAGGLRPKRTEWVTMASV